MIRVKFVLAAIMAVVVTVSGSDMFAQDACCDSGVRARRVGFIARIRANRSTYTNNNCCPTQTADPCCQAAAAPCCQTATACCATPAPCCQTACCDTAPACGGCNDSHANSGCCRQGGLFANRRANRGSNSAYTSHTTDCCGTTSGCSGCAGCAGGQIMQGSSEGVIVPEASGQPVAPDAPVPTPDSTKST